MAIQEDLLLAQTQLIDLRGRTSLSQLAGACQKTRAVLSVDAGPLHIAAAVGTPTLAIVGNDAEGVGASPIRLWMPRCEMLSIYSILNHVICVLTPILVIISASLMSISACIQ